jgi:hypothetical protein
MYNLRVGGPTAEGTEATVTVDYTYDGTGGTVAYLIPIFEKKGQKGVPGWFGSDPVLISEGRGMATINSDSAERARRLNQEAARTMKYGGLNEQEALALIRVEYEELPAVFDVEEAMGPGAPEIHPTHPKVSEPYKNIGGKTETAWGDVETGFRESYLVREDRFSSQLRTHAYMEPQATVASFDHSGKLNVWRYLPALSFDAFFFNMIIGGPPA